MTEEVKVSDFRTAFKNADGKVEETALPPVESETQPAAIMIEPGVADKFGHRMMQQWYVMNESMRAALQVVDQHLPTSISITPGVNPAVVESMRFQSAAILAGKLFDEMKGMVNEIKFVPMPSPAKE